MEQETENDAEFESPPAPTAETTTEPKLCPFARAIGNITALELSLIDLCHKAFEADIPLGSIERALDNVRRDIPAIGNVIAAEATSNQMAALSVREGGSKPTRPREDTSGIGIV